MKIERKKEIIETFEISKEDFKSYEDIRKSGITNMLNVGYVSVLSGLSKNKIKLIMENYNKLSEGLFNSLTEQKQNYKGGFNKKNE